MEVLVTIEIPALWSKASPGEQTQINALTVIQASAVAAMEEIIQYGFIGKQLLTQPACVGIEASAPLCLANTPT